MNSCRFPSFPTHTTIIHPVSIFHPSPSKKKKAEHRKSLFCLLFQRSGRDSNPRAVARKLISSQPRYDHFDTSPCLSQHLTPEKHLGFWGELMGEHIWFLAFDSSEHPMISRVPGFEGYIKAIRSGDSYSPIAFHRVHRKFTVFDLNCRYIPTSDRKTKICSFFILQNAKNRALIPAQLNNDLCNA